MQVSLCDSAVAHGSNFRVFLGNIGVKLLVLEASKRWFDVVSLAHFEVLAEVLVTAPPVSVDQSKSLVSANLMEVRVANVVLLAISRETTVTDCSSVVFVGLTNSPSIVFNHGFLLTSDLEVENEGLIEVEPHENPHQTNTVLLVEDVGFPINVSSRVFKETRNIFECSPSLGIITRLFGRVNELSEITVSFLGESSVKCRE